MKTSVRNLLRNISVCVTLVVCSFFLVLSPSYAGANISSGSSFSDGSTFSLTGNYYATGILVADGTARDDAQQGKTIQKDKVRPQSAPAKTSNYPTTSAPNQQPSKVVESKPSSATDSTPGDR